MLGGGALVALGAGVAVALFGLGVGVGLAGTVVAVGGAEVAVGAATVAVGGTAVLVAVGGIGVGVIVGLAVGGGGGGPIGVGIVAGGGGGVLAAANECRTGECIEPATAIIPTVTGSARPSANRLFIRDSLRFEIAFGSRGEPHTYFRAASISLHENRTRELGTGPICPHLGSAHDLGSLSLPGSRHPPFRQSVKVCRGTRPQHVHHTGDGR
ncbi:MAG: hypothetical protein PVSMB7_28480 [Chloroflexota bacterium]